MVKKLRKLRKLPKEPRRLASLPVTSRRQFPTSKGLYFVMEGRRVQYIGKTADSFRNRWCSWGGHHKFKQAKRVNARVHFWPLTCDDAEIDGLETDAIRRWRPAWNVAKKPKHRKKKSPMVQPVGPIEWIFWACVGALLAWMLQ